MISHGDIIWKQRNSVALLSSDLEVSNLYFNLTQLVLIINYKISLACHVTMIDSDTYSNNSIMLLIGDI